MEVMLRAGTPIPMVAQMAELSEIVVRKMAEEHGFKFRRGEGAFIATKEQWNHCYSFVRDLFEVWH